MSNENETKREIPNQHLADKIAGKVDHNNVVVNKDEQLGSVEENIPTELAGIKLETEDEVSDEEKAKVNEVESTEEVK